MRLIKVLGSSERKYLQERLKAQYGIEDGFEEYVLIKAGQGRIRATTPEALEVASKLRKVQQIGLYVVKLVKSDVILSIEGSQLLNGKIKRNVIELSEPEAENWMKASPIQKPVKLGSRYVVARCGELYLGSGRASRDGKIYPQIAKWRRIPEE